MESTKRKALPILILLCIVLALCVGVIAFVAAGNNDGEGEIYYEIYNNGVCVYTSYSPELSEGIMATPINAQVAPQQNEEYVIECYRDVNFSEKDLCINNFESYASSPKNVYNVVIDLNGNTYNSKSDLLLGLKSGDAWYDATLTIKDGIFKRAASAQHMKTRKGYTVIFDNVYFEKDNPKNNMFYDDGMKAVIFRNCTVDALWTNYVLKKYTLPTETQFVFDNTTVNLGSAEDFYTLIPQEKSKGHATAQIIFTNGSRISYTSGSPVHTGAYENGADDLTYDVELLIEAGTILDKEFDNGGKEIKVYKSIRQDESGRYVAEELIEEPKYNGTLDATYTLGIGSKAVSVTLVYEDNGQTVTATYEGLTDGLAVTKRLSDMGAYFNAEDNDTVWVETFEGWSVTEGDTAGQLAYRLTEDQVTLYPVFAQRACALAELSADGQYIIGHYVEAQLTDKILYAVMSGNKLTLYADCTYVGEGYNITDALELDLNGKTLYIDESAGYLSFSTDSVIYNGCLDVSASRGIEVVSGTLTLTELQINYDTVAPIAVNGGSLKITDSSVKGVSVTEDPELIRVFSGLGVISIEGCKVDTAGDLIYFAPTARMTATFSISVKNTEFERINYLVGVSDDASLYNDGSTVKILLIDSDTNGKVITEGCFGEAVEVAVEDYSGENTPKPDDSDAPVVGVN